MRYAIPLGVSALLVAVAVAAPVPPPNAREAAQLIKELGSEDYVEREAATKRLDALGLLALAELRAATKSENPEIADRAKDLVRKIERRAANELTLTPTTVELDLNDTALDAVLAALSKQADCEIVLGGLKANELAGKKITVATGKVPFWTAVQKVCDAGGLQVASASGFIAPGAMPYNIRPGKTDDGTPVRTAANHNVAVVLEAREGSKRPASVHGAVMVEAFELPKTAASKTVAGVVLQVWPEPKLAWQSNADAKVTKATDADGRKIIPDVTTPLPVPVVRNRLDPIPPPLPGGTNFAPNARQSLIKLKTGVSTATELTGSVFGLVRSGIEPLATVPLDPDKPVTASGTPGVELTASVRTDGKGRKFVEVTLYYEPLRVQPARQSDELQGVKPNASGSNLTVLGLRVTDANGKAFDLALPTQRSDFDPTGRQIIARLTLEVLAGKDGPSVPAKVVFWGSYAKPVEVPFALKDVPLVGGTK